MIRTSNIIKSIDWVTVVLYVILVFIGWINIYAAVYNEKHSSILDFSQKYGIQLIWIIAAFVIAFIIFLIDSNFFEYFSWPIYIVMILLLISVFIFGKETNGQKAWFEIGAFKLQPSEFMKFATNLALAKLISTYNFKISNFKNFLSILAIFVIPSILILLQNDTGSALVYLAFVFMLYREGLTPFVLFLALISIILFIAALLVDKFIILQVLLYVSPIIFYILHPRFKTLIYGVTLFLVTFGILYLINILYFKYNIYYIVFSSIILYSTFVIIYSQKKKIAHATIIILFVLFSSGFTFTVDYIFNNVLEKHQQDRINELLGIKSDPLGTGYNVNQSKIAIGSGGFSGKGFLQGTQTKYNFVPEQSTDFIFCTVGEEHGFVGSFIVIVLFTALFLRVVYVSERQRTNFSRIYGYGVASLLFFHFVVNIGMTIGLAPVIGIPLPFFSYGGSSLWSFTILLFIFLRLDSNRFEKLA